MDPETDTTEAVTEKSSFKQKSEIPGSFYLDYESVLSPFFKCNMKRAFQEKYERSTTNPWQTNHIGFGHPPWQEQEKP